MQRFRHRPTSQQRSFQARPRMRVPPIMLEATHQIHVVSAIRRNREIDKDDLYSRALRDITHGDNSAVFADVSKLIEGVVSGKLKGNSRDATERTLVGLHRLDRDDDAYPNIFEFNRRFLNDRGFFALLTILILDAAKLDLVTIDNLQGRRGSRSCLRTTTDATDRRGWAGRSKIASSNLQ